MDAVNEVAHAVEQRAAGTIAPRSAHVGVVRTSGDSAESRRRAFGGTLSDRHPRGASGRPAGAGWTWLMVVILSSTWVLGVKRDRVAEESRSRCASTARCIERRHAQVWQPVPRREMQLG
jgi:hypothetical protein